MTAVERTNNLFEMTVDINVLEDLGINLDSNTTAVPNEAAANVWAVN